GGRGIPCPETDLRLPAVRLAPAARQGTRGPAAAVRHASIALPGRRRRSQGTGEQWQRPAPRASSRCGTGRLDCGGQRPVEPRRDDHARVTPYLVRFSVLMNSRPAGGARVTRARQASRLNTFVLFDGPPALPLDALENRQVDFQRLQALRERAKRRGL